MTYALAFIAGVIIAAPFCVRDIRVARRRRQAERDYWLGSEKEERPNG